MFEIREGYSSREMLYVLVLIGEPLRPFYATKFRGDWSPSRRRVWAVEISVATSTPTPANKHKN